MEELEVGIIGAGVVGLSICASLTSKGKEAFIFEKNETFGMETSERNSEVIHAGIYYPKGSLMEKFCKHGRDKIYSLASQGFVNAKKLEKLIVATEESEIEKLEMIFDQGIENGINIEMIGEKEIKELESKINAVSGIISYDTGIVDAHSLMNYYRSVSKENSYGMEPILYKSEIVGVDFDTDGYEIAVRNGKEEIEKYRCNVLINSAGLYSDKISEMVGINEESYTIHFCKGEYFKINEKHEGKVSRLIYPVPVPGGLGTHLTLDMGGGMKLGPNVNYIDSINYEVDVNHLDEFYHAGKKFLPFLEKDDLRADMAGVRPKIYRKGEKKRDFVIKHEDEKGFPGFFNLIGIESPGLTCSPEIGEYVSEWVIDYLKS